MRTLALVAALLTLVMAAGCEKATPPTEAQPGTNQAGEQSGGIIGTMLQYDTLKAGKRAQERARQAVSAHDERTKEVMADDQ